MTLSNFKRGYYICDLCTIWSSIFQDLYKLVVPAVMSLSEWLPAHEDRITCTGRQLAENLADFADLTPGQKVALCPLKFKTCRWSIDHLA